jgi:FKBP-type peptidyl-prolyl cis-trans isomerase
MTIKYTGKLTSGIVFSSSAENGKPVQSSNPSVFTHKLGEDGLIKGLEESLRDMKTGEKRLLVIPPELGYGLKAAYYAKETSGKRFVISPGEPLIMEVTLIKISE